MKDRLIKQLKDVFSYSQEPRSDKKIHVSDLANNFCSRRFMLCRQLKRPFHAAKYVTMGEGLTFELGRRIQSGVLANLLRHKDLDVVGLWECPKCDASQISFYKKGCPKCGHKHIKYNEVTLQLPISKNLILTGNPDILLYSREVDSTMTIECKSIKVEEFDLLEYPKPAHALQLMGYLWLLKKLHANDLYKLNMEKGVVLYVAKAQRDIPFKVFEVELDEAFNYKMDSIFNDLKSGAKQLPERLCSNQRGLVARKCPEVNICFKAAEVI